MWFIGTPFERHLKSLAKDQESIKNAILRIIIMERNELATLQEEHKQVQEGTKEITELYKETEKEESLIENAKTHNPATASLTKEEENIIEDKKATERRIFNLNTEIQGIIAEQIRLLTNTHGFTIGIEKRYNAIIQYNKTIANVESLKGMYQLFEDLKNTVYTKELPVINTIEKFRREKDSKRQEIIELCQKLEYDDEKIKRIAGMIISIDKTDSHIQQQMGSMQQIH